MRKEKRAGKLFGELIFCVVRDLRLAIQSSKSFEAQRTLLAIGTAECFSHGTSAIAASFVPNRWYVDLGAVDIRDTADRRSKPRLGLQVSDRRA